MFEIPVPDEWQGRSIAQLDIRKKYNINIIGLRNGGKLEMPVLPDTVLNADAALLVLGKNKDLQKCFRT